MRFSFLLCCSLVFFHYLSAQEYKSSKNYQKETGNNTLKDGAWIKKDRKQNNKRWANANLYNLQIVNGHLKYSSIAQIRDFYRWFDKLRLERGDEIKWIGIASIACNQLSKIDQSFIRSFIVNNEEIVDFAYNGCKKVFEYTFPKLQKVYILKEPLKDKQAEEWDQFHGKEEQCLILSPLYNKLSKKTIEKLDKMAKGKCIFKLGVPKKLRYEGDLLDCNDRFNHGLNKLIPYYIHHKN